jgi:general L-amino acid transport system substrate-binding protein
MEPKMIGALAWALIATVALVIVAVTMSGESEGWEDNHYDAVTTIKNRGYLKCGVIDYAPWANLAQSNGFDYTFCEAVAAAIFGDPTMMTPVNVPIPDRFSSLAAGDFDVLFAVATRTFEREVGYEVNFATSAYFFEATGLIINDAVGPQFGNPTTVTQINGTGTFCAQAGGTYIAIVEAHLPGFTAITFPDHATTLAGFQNGTCDLFVNGLLSIPSDLAVLNANGQAFTALTGSVALEALHAATPATDKLHDFRFDQVVNWVMDALIIAEEEGVTAANIDTLTPSNTADYHLIGLENDGVTPWAMPALIGLPSDFAKQVISAVGNYGEIYAAEMEAVLPRAGTPNALLLANVGETPGGIFAGEL